MRPDYLARPLKLAASTRCPPAAALTAAPSSRRPACSTRILGEIKNFEPSSPAAGRSARILRLFIEAFRRITFDTVFFLPFLGLLLDLLQLWVDGGGVYAFADVLADVGEDEFHVFGCIIIKNRRLRNFLNLLFLWFIF